MESSDTLSQGLAGRENVPDFSGRSLFLAGADERTKRYWRSIDHAADEQAERLRRSGETVPLSVDSGRKAGIFKGPRDERYSVSLTFCNCPDFIKRRRPCEHMYRLADELESLETSPKNPRRDALPVSNVVHCENSECALRQTKIEHENVHEETRRSENRVSWSLESVLIVAAIVSMVIGAVGAIGSFGTPPGAGGSEEKSSVRNVSSHPGHSSSPSPAKTATEEQEQSKNAAGAAGKANEKADQPQSSAHPKQASLPPEIPEISAERRAPAPHSRSMPPSQSEASRKPVGQSTAKAPASAPETPAASEKPKTTPASAPPRSDAERGLQASPGSPSSPPPRQPARSSESPSRVSSRTRDPALARESPPIMPPPQGKPPVRSEAPEKPAGVATAKTVEYDLEELMAFEDPDLAPPPPRFDAGPRPQAASDSPPSHPSKQPQRRNDAGDPTNKSVAVHMLEELIKLDAGQGTP